MIRRIDHTGNGCWQFGCAEDEWDWNESDGWISFRLVPGAEPFVSLSCAGFVDCGNEIDHYLPIDVTTVSTLREMAARLTSLADETERLLEKE